jgi:tetratricopeptide (TPR) repeat protein
MRALAALAFIAALNGAVNRLYISPVPPAQTVRLSPEDAVRTMGFMALGMRRLAADISFIQLLVYYGSPEEEPERPFDYLAQYYSSERHGEHHHENYEGGSYPELGPRALRILELDPLFSYAPLYSAGALAFNLQRPDEAVALLDEARKREPKNWRYSTTIAAIGFHRKGDGEKVLAELAPVLSDPDCPTMLKNIAAFLNVRTGRKAEAVRLYREILLSRDVNYREEARKSLEKLGTAP